MVALTIEIINYLQTSFRIYLIDNKIITVFITSSLHFINVLILTKNAKIKKKLNSADASNDFTLRLLKSVKRRLCCENKSRQNPFLNISKL